MLLVYASRTNNIETIVTRLNLPVNRVLNISDGYTEELSEDFILLTYTDLMGHVPDVVNSFLERNYRRLKAVAGSGNRNFGNNFCGAAVKIAKRYGVDILAKFELAGNEKEIREFRQRLSSLS